MSNLTGWLKSETGLGGLNSIFQAAFTGGGGALGAVKSFATQGLSTLLGMIPGVGPFISQFSGAIIAGFAKISSAVKNLFSGIFGGPDANEREGNTLADAFRADLATALTEAQKLETQAAVNAGANRAWAESTIAIRDAYLAAGKTEEDALAIADRLWRAQQQGGDAVRRVIEEISAVLNTTLTPATQQAATTFTQTTQRAVVGFQAVRDEVRLLTTQAILSEDDGLLGALQAMEASVTAAAAAGVTDFAFMMVAIEAMKAQLATPIVIPVRFDVSGYGDIGQARPSEVAEAAGWSDAQARREIQSFLDSNAGHEGRGDDRGRLSSALGITPERAKDLGFQHGSAGLQDFGRSGTWAQLHDEEEVLTRQQSEGVATMVARALRSSARGDGQQTINVYLDGQLLTSTVVRHMPRVLSLHGVA